jgi:hypothetical protein
MRDPSADMSTGGGGIIATEEDAALVVSSALEQLWPKFVLLAAALDAIGVDCRCHLRAVQDLIGITFEAGRTGDGRCMVSCKAMTAAAAPLRGAGGRDVSVLFWLCASEMMR